MANPTILNFKLARPARKNGGDRYEAELERNEKPFIIYIPQSLSRTAGTPALNIKVTFNKE